VEWTGSTGQRSRGATSEARQGEGRHEQGAAQERHRGDVLSPGSTSDEQPCSGPPSLSPQPDKPWRSLGNKRIRRKRSDGLPGAELPESRSISPLPSSEEVGRLLRLSGATPAITTAPLPPGSWTVHTSRSSLPGALVVQPSCGPPHTICVTAVIYLQGVQYLTPGWGVRQEGQAHERGEPLPKRMARLGLAERGPEPSLR
jgi:hypothetical protein